MNKDIFFFFYSLAHKSEFFDRLVIFSAVYLPYIVVVLIGIFLLVHHHVLLSQNPITEFFKKWKEIIIVFFSGVIAWILADIIKILIHSPRPFILFSNVQNIFPESGYAFPSGHATFFMAIAVSLFFSHKKAGYVFMFFALIISIARITGGVHSPIDILGGFILGTLISIMINKFANLKKSV